MFSALFLFLAGFVMVLTTLLGVRRGRVMTLGKSGSGDGAKWAARGDAEFLPYVLIWICAGVFLVYQGIRLFNLV